MELYFLRHAIAAQRDDPKYKEDSLRALTDEGRGKMRRAALGMQALGLKFDAIFSSPFLRAKQTAEIVAQAYKIKNKTIFATSKSSKKSEDSLPAKRKLQAIHLTNNLLPPASIEELLQEVRASFPKSKNVLLVGHEPHLSEMISSLLKSNKPLAIDFKKAGLCCLSIDQPLGRPSAVLNWLLTPAQLGFMAKQKQ